MEFKQRAIRKTDNGTIGLTLWKGRRYDTGLPWQNDIGVARLAWDRKRYVIQYTGDMETPELSEERGRLGGCDIGEIHPTARCVPTGETVIVSGRAIRSIKQFRNKSLGERYRRRSRGKRGSRMYKRLGRRIAGVCQRSENSCRDAFDKSTRKAVRAAKALKVDTLVIGDPRGVADKPKQRKRLNRKARQKVAQMETGTIKRFLDYKATLAGIRARFNEERGTASECPVCAAANRCKVRGYRSGGCGLNERFRSIVQERPRAWKVLTGPCWRGSLALACTAELVHSLML